MVAHVFGAQPRNREMGKDSYHLPRVPSAEICASTYDGGQIRHSRVDFVIKAFWIASFGKVGASVAVVFDVMGSIRSVRNQCDRPEDGSEQIVRPRAAKQRPMGSFMKQVLQSNERCPNHQPTTDSA